MNTWMPVKAQCANADWFVRGHDDVIAKLLRLYQRSQWSRTFVFSGLPGIGKKALAWNFAQFLLCERRSSTLDADLSARPCGHCGSCRRVLLRQSESVLELSPGAVGSSNSSNNNSSANTSSIGNVSVESGSVIKVEQAHSLIEFLSLQAVAAARVVIIDEAHLLNIQAANALLKTLEEPPPNTVIFMITSHFQALLPTLRSRAQHLRFSPLSHSVLLELLKRENLAHEDWLLDAAQGSWAELRSLIDSSDEIVELRRLAQVYLQNLVSSQFSETLPATRETLREKFKDRQVALFTLKIWARMLRQEISVQETSNNKFILYIHKLFQLILRLEQDVRRHVDRGLILEHLEAMARIWSEWSEEKLQLHVLEESLT